MTEVVHLGQEESGSDHHLVSFISFPSSRLVNSVPVNWTTIPVNWGTVPAMWSTAGTAPGQGLGVPPCSRTSRALLDQRRSISAAVRAT